jgi:hypothetical protein
VNAHLAFLLSCLYEGGLHPPHLADLRKSGLSDETIARQKIRSVLPNLISQLLGFPGSKVMSALLFPFPCPTSRFMDHIRMKIFPALKTKKGSVKYLQPRHSGMRLYFPLATLDRALHRGEPLWLVEGEKKSLVAAQLGLPAVGFCGIEGGTPKAHRICSATSIASACAGASSNWCPIVTGRPIRTWSAASTGSPRP